MDRRPLLWSNGVGCPIKNGSLVLYSAGCHFTNPYLVCICKCTKKDSCYDIIWEVFLIEFLFLKFFSITPKVCWKFDNSNFVIVWYLLSSCKSRKAPISMLTWNQGCTILSAKTAYLKNKHQELLLTIRKIKSCCSVLLYYDKEELPILQKCHHILTRLVATACVVIYCFLI